jgi:hypothetical protein
MPKFYRESSDTIVDLENIVVVIDAKSYAGADCPAEQQSFLVMKAGHEYSHFSKKTVDEWWAILAKHTPVAED